jgi:PAS domain S-box-containing protein
MGRVAESNIQKKGPNGVNAIRKQKLLELFRKRVLQYSSRKMLERISFALAILVLVTFVIISHRAGRQLQQAIEKVANTRNVLEKLENVTGELSATESAARSFAISGKQLDLSPFYTAAEAVPPQVEELNVLLKDDPQELQSLTAIEPVIAEDLQVMKNMVELGDKNLFRGYSQRNLSDQGNALMGQIKDALRTLENDQQTLLDQEQTLEAAKINRVSMISLVGSLLGSTVILLCGARAMRALEGRRKAEEKLDRLLGSMPDALVIVNATGKIVGSNAQSEKLFGYNDRELQGESMALLVPERFRKNQRDYYAAYFSPREGRAPQMTMELCGLHKDGREFPIEVSTKPLASEKGLIVTSMIRDITRSKQVAHEISKLNKELEQRAIELEHANKELEAFSYSVSHDLRSPLQNIDRFSQILVEEYANQLNTEGLDYVQRLRGSCRHMEDIIDALLALSDMMRKELAPGHFDLSALANTVVNDFKQKNPDRLVDWKIADGLTAYGDAQLLRVVLENLFGNAWKFTANRPCAHIEFGALPQANGARTYYVRDDGAGFDMERAGKLFTPFKRLHDQSEFRGTGIGLATVQRVIQRHQGKIWAEGIVNQGATFCFTLTNGNEASNGSNNHHTRS